MNNFTRGFAKKSGSFFKYLHDTTNRLVDQVSEDSILRGRRPSPPS